MSRTTKRSRTEVGPPGKPDEGKFIAVYVRLSGRDRPVDAQQADLKRWAGGQDRAVRWYEDVWNGRGKERPAGEGLVKDLKAGRVHTLTCWRLDRLGMTCSELVILFEELAAHEVNLLSLKDHLDLSTPAGRRMANALASVGLYETELRAERILAGQEAARARGVRWGGSPKGRRIKVTPELEATVRRLRAEGKGASHIARETGLSRPTIYRVLRTAGPNVGDEVGPPREGPDDGA